MASTCERSFCLPTRLELQPGLGLYMDAGVKLRSPCLSIKPSYPYLELQIYLSTPSRAWGYKHEPHMSLPGTFLKAFGVRKVPLPPSFKLEDSIAWPHVTIRALKADMSGEYELSLVQLWVGCGIQMYEEDRQKVTTLSMKGQRGLPNS